MWLIERTAVQMPATMFFRHGENLLARQARRRAVHIGDNPELAVADALQFDAVLRTLDPEFGLIVETRRSGRHDVSSQCRRLRRFDDLPIDDVALKQLFPVFVIMARIPAQGLNGYHIGSAVLGVTPGA